VICRNILILYQILVLMDALPYGYSGFRPDKNWDIPRIRPSISSDHFFDQFVSLRKPVIIEGTLIDPEWKGHLWSNTYLKEKAGKAVLKVEQSNPDGHFGTGLSRLNMTFSEFLEKNSSDCTIYLTTQYNDQEVEDVNEDDSEQDPTLAVAEIRKSMMPSHVAELFGDFPLKPSLLGNLIPQQFNIWMGNSKNGSSSGLHHDFHDNLYVLLRGQKRFTIICPAEAPNLYTNGTIAQIHPNGLINYEGNLTRSDGVPELEATHLKIEEVQIELDQLRENGESEEEINKVEKKQEALMEILLKASGGVSLLEDDGDDEEEDDEPVKGKIETEKEQEPKKEKQTKKEPEVENKKTSRT